MSKMFENMSILMIGSSHFESDDVLKIKELLEIHGVEQVAVKKETDKRCKRLPLYTHIIANSIGFADYHDYASAMVPVVTSQWVLDCIANEKLVPLRPYNPDPKFFFKDLVITVSDSVPLGDKEAIYSGVRALGGQYSDQLLLTTTHLISLDANDDLSSVARECNLTEESDIQVVIPAWIDDCFKLRRKLDESPYLLFDHAGQYREPSLADIDVRRSHGDEKKLSQPRVRNQFLQKTVFYICADLALSETSRQTVIEMIRATGGEVVDKLDDSTSSTEAVAATATAYIGKYRSGDEYIEASRLGLVVGNLQWVYYMMAHDAWIFPTEKLLHYPVVRHGLPGFDKFVVGVTNYTGDGRFYLESLITAMGGVFTKNLKSVNTHLICAKPVGKKYEAAIQWQKSGTSGIKLVNHLWLEESYARWKILDEEMPRYQYFPKDLNFTKILGQTTLDEEVLRGFYRENNGQEIVDDSVDVEENKENIETELEAEKVKEKEVMKRVREGDKEKEVKRDGDKEKIEEHRRSAKLKAAIKLHSDMEDLNSYQKKKQKKEKYVNYDLDVIITGCDSLELNELSIEMLTRHGIIVIQDLDRVDTKKKLVLVAPRVLRTEKFLSSLSFKLEGIVTPDFITELLADHSKKVELSSYAVPEVGRLLHNEELCFTGIKFVILSTPSDKEKNKAYERIIMRHGCEGCVMVDTITELEKEVKKESEVKVLSKKKLKKYGSVDHDWVVSQIMYANDNNNKQQQQQ